MSLPNSQPFLDTSPDCFINNSNEYGGGNYFSTADRLYQSDYSPLQVQEKLPYGAVQQQDAIFTPITTTNSHYITALGR